MKTQCKLGLGFFFRQKKKRRNGSPWNVQQKCCVKCADLVGNFQKLLIIRTWNSTSNRIVLLNVNSLEIRRPFRWMFNSLIPRLIVNINLLICLYRNHFHRFILIIMQFNEEIVVLKNEIKELIAVFTVTF